MLSSLRAAVLATTAAVALCGAGPSLAQSSIVLNTLWETRPTTNDYMTTNYSVERDMFTVRGAYAYIPQAALTGTIPLYRLLNLGGPDHMNSTVAGESGYTTEHTLGNVWTTATMKPGTGKILRLWNTSTGDHAQVKDGDSIAGYNHTDDPGIYGYLRYNNQNEVLDTLSAGGVTIKSNRVAGGIVWSWVWNGVEFLNKVDYGQQMQTSVFFKEGGVDRTPTEGGSRHATTPSTPYKNQGSPLASISTVGNTQSTRAIPLEWEPSLWGGDANHPVIYQDMMIGKDITLNFNNMGPVAKYTTQVSTASSISDTEIEAPIAYLPPTFNRFWIYDAVSHALVEKFPSSGLCPGFEQYQPASGFGGVIISNSSGSHAIGIYGRVVAQGGTVNYFELINYIGCASTSAVKASVNRKPLPAGTNSFNSYVITDTLANVQLHMQALYGASVY